MQEEKLYTNNNVAYRCHYHVVWCPKYRRKVLINGVDTRSLATFVKSFLA